MSRAERLMSRPAPVDGLSTLDEQLSGLLGTSDAGIFLFRWEVDGRVFVRLRVRRAPDGDMSYVWIDDDDPDVIRYFVDSLQPEVVEELDRGNSLGSALELAGSTLETRPSEDGRQAILVISDGDVYEDEDVLVRAAADAAARGFEVWIAGLGSEAGSPISIAGEPVLDAAGRAVRTSQNADLLSAMAEAGQGRYEDITEDGGLDSLVDDLRDLSGDSREGPAEPFDTTALFALLAIPLLLWEGAVDARRGVIGGGTNQRTDEPDAVRGHGGRAQAA